MAEVHFSLHNEASCDSIKIVKVDAGTYFDISYKIW